MLQAREYWRLEGLSADVVIIVNQSAAPRRLSHRLLVTLREATRAAAAS